jgi:benzoyl-CoA reductase/2-hydroxyglutaryl-CoA dehydratase subunit BcrC/BadD/HgdB
VDAVKKFFKYGVADPRAQQSWFTALLRVFVFFQDVDAFSNDPGQMASNLASRFEQGCGIVKLEGSRRVIDGQIMWYGLVLPAHV